MTPKAVLLAAGLLLGFAGVAAAHHSGAAYDQEHQQKIEGAGLQQQ